MLNGSGKDTNAILYLPTELHRSTTAARGRRYTPTRRDARDRRSRGSCPRTGAPGGRRDQAHDRGCDHPCSGAGSPARPTLLPLLGYADVPTPSADARSCPPDRAAGHPKSGRRMVLGAQAVCVDGGCPERRGIWSGGPVADDTRGQGGPACAAGVGRRGGGPSLAGQDQRGQGQAELECDGQATSPRASRLAPPEESLLGRITRKEIEVACRRP